MRSLTAAVAAALVLLTATPASAANSAPVVVDDAVSYRNTGGIDYVVAALANDSDPDGDTLTYTAVGPATKGNAYLQAGKLYYKPFLGNTGTDSFTYTVSDGSGNTATGTVTATLWVDPADAGNLAITSPAPGSATVTWSAAARASGYRVYRNGLLVASTSGLSWTDTGLLDTEWYRYQIASVNGGGYENLWAFTPTVHWQPQPTPTGLAVDVTDDGTTLALTWLAGGRSGPWNVYRDGTLVASSTTAAFTDTGLVTGREYTYQVQLASSSSATVVYPPSPLSVAVRGTPVELTAIGQLFWDRGWTSGDLGAVTVPERAIPGGRQQDHTRGIIVQQDGEVPFSVRIDFVSTYAAAGGAPGDLGFPLGERECGLRDNGCGQFFEGGSIWYQQSTGTWVVPQVIEDGWVAAGAEEGPLGYPVDEPVDLDGGFGQAFEGGAVFWTPDTGSHGVSGPVLGRWAASGWEIGALGYPTSDEIEVQNGTRQSFEGGTISWSPAGGTRLVTGPVLDAWARSGYEDGPLGQPVAEEGALRGGRGQAFQGGAVYWSPAGGAHAVSGAIRARWGLSGWENGAFGYPLSDVIALNGGTGQVFQGGTIWWSATGGAHLVGGALREAWARSGSENGPLGYPVTDMLVLREGGTGQIFTGGSLYSSPAGGMHAVSGALRTAWAGLGAEHGLGYPLTDEIPLNGGSGQVFQRGTIWSSASGGAHLVTGALRTAWGARGWETGALGYPTSDQASLRDGGVRQTFTGGTLYWSRDGGARVVNGAIRDAWAGLGAENGSLGYPLTDEIALIGGTGQVFQGGTIWWSASGGAHPVTGAMRAAWGARGWENGALGYPRSGQVALRDGGVRQTFTGGTLYWSRDGGARVVNGAIRDAWAAQGAENGSLGYPLTDEIALIGGTGQVFQGGTIWWSASGGAHAIRGAIRAAWGSQGWENGRLGYPTSDEVISGGARRQDFQGGTITVDLATGRPSITYL